MSRTSLVSTILLLLAAPLLAAGDSERISNWTAPPFWTPPSQYELEERAFGREPLETDPAAVDPLPSSPMPFVAITPCRLADTRGNGFTGSYGPPALVAGSPRGFPITGQCGIPSGAGAVSFNVTVTNTLGAGFILAYPSGGAPPSVSTLNYVASQTVANAAIVPLSAGGAATFIAGVRGTDLILDVNGYYAPVNLVNTVNGVSGDLTLAQGANVTITPTGSTLTIASSPGTHAHAATDITSGTLPDGRLTGSYSGALTLSSASNVFTGSTLTLGGDLQLGVVSRVTMAGFGLLHTTGISSFFAGYAAGNFSSTASGATGIGYSALANLTSGNANTGVGTGALGSTSTGAENTAVGEDALGASNASWNTAVGASSLSSNTMGERNSALGWHALAANSTSSDSTAVGHAALAASTGAYNTAVGSQALDANTSGARNVAVGAYALSANSAGYDNTACGQQSLFVSTEFGNTAVGSGALASMTAGSRNVAIGWGAGGSLDSGSDNIYVGQGVGVSGGESNTIRIGSSWHTRAFLGGIWGVTAASGMSVYVSSDGQLGTTTSSRRYKRDITDLGAASAVLLQLRPVAFRYTEERDPSGEQQYGLIAEEVAEVAPDLVVYGKDGQPESVKYHLVNALLLNELQKQRQEIQELRRALEELRREMTPSR